MYTYNIHFFTTTFLDWKYLLKETVCKQIILESLSFLTKQKRVRIFSFVE